MRDVEGRVERKKKRKPWIAQDITSQMDERRKRKNVNDDE
jgi:hypothetical protein